MQKLVLICLLFLGTKCFGQKLTIGAGLLYPHFYWTVKEQRIRKVNYGQYGFELNASTQFRKLICTFGYRNIKQNLTETVDHEPPSWAVYKYIYSRKIYGLTIGLGAQILKFKNWSVEYQTGIIVYQSNKTYFKGETTQNQFIDTFFKTSGYNNSWAQIQKVDVKFHLTKKLYLGIGGQFEFRINPFKDLLQYVYIKQDSRMNHCLTFNIHYNLLR